VVDSSRFAGIFTSELTAHRRADALRPRLSRRRRSTSLSSRSAIRRQPFTSRSQEGTGGSRGPGARRRLSPALTTFCAVFSWLSAGSRYAARGGSVTRAFPVRARLLRRLHPEACLLTPSSCFWSRAEPEVSLSSDEVSGRYAVFCRDVDVAPVEDSQQWSCASLVRLAPGLLDGPGSKAPAADLVREARSPPLRARRARRFRTAGLSSVPLRRHVLEEFVDQHGADAV